MKPSEVIEAAAKAIDESEVIAIERNNPMYSTFRELWPVDGSPLAELLRASTGYWRLYEDRGWSEQRLNASVGAAALAALAFAKAVLKAQTEGLEASTDV